ncbi:MAG: ester cyclase [Candidatus Bathyarchaeia archaeon]|jgi:predicted ester cyclase
MNTIEENKAIIQKFIDSYNNRNLEIFDTLVASDYFDHTHKQQGREKIKQLFTMAFEGFPDWHETIEDIIAEGEWVWVRVKATGTHTGRWTLFGVPLPPTGNKIVMPMVFFFRIQNGKLVEGGEVDDQQDFFKQLGLIEYTDKGKQVLGSQ